MKFVIFHNSNDGTLETEPPYPGAVLEDWSTQVHHFKRTYRGWRIEFDSMETFGVFLEDLRADYGFAHIGAEDYGPYIALDGFSADGDTRILDQEDEEIRRWGRSHDMMVFRRDRLKIPPPACDVEILSEVRVPDSDS